MNDQDRLEDHRRAIGDSVEYFSSAHKAERESWVVESFLSIMRVDFKSEEIVSVQDEPPDVRFREAEFEVKEILDSDRQLLRNAK